MSPAGFGHESDCTGEGQQQLKKDRPILLSERMLHKDYNRKCLIEKNETLVVSLKELVAKTN
jgi:hypothetical protein